MVAVSMLAVGKIGYALAARESLRALLARTDFDLFVTTDEMGAGLLPASPRLRVNVVSDLPGARADAFLGKFAALAFCLAQSTSDLILQLDADAIVLRELHESAVRDALGGHELAMAEQTTIVGSTMGRAEFLRHYTDHSLAFIAPGQVSPHLDDFHFHNSGVVLASRQGAERFLAWARTRHAALPPEHRVGKHMIADQDYFQVWANSVAPGSTGLLPSNWNHCAHWDLDYPRAGARIAHFSNFCDGPTVGTVSDMRALGVAGEPRLGAPTRDLTFVIVTHNSEQTLGTCLEALADLGGHVIVVDNASTDGTLEVCRKFGASVIENRTNEGFAAAANRGAATATTGAICFLNPDCLLTGTAVAEAVRVLSVTPDAIAVPDFVDWDGRRWPGRQGAYTVRRLVADVLHGQGLALLAGPLHRAAAASAPAWHWPIGACVFMRRETFAALGGFDVRYFCYMEDVALGKAAHVHGIEVVTVPALVPHFGARGADVGHKQRSALIDGARLTYAELNHGPLLAYALRGLHGSLRLLRGAWRRLRSSGAILARRPS